MQHFHLIACGDSCRIVVSENIAKSPGISWHFVATIKSWLSQWLSTVTNICTLIYAAWKCSAVIKYSIYILRLAFIWVFKCYFCHSLFCLNAYFLYMKFIKMLSCQSSYILQPVLNMILLVGLCLSAVFINYAFQFWKSVFIRNLFYSRIAMALLIPRWQVAWKLSVEQTQAVSTWGFFDCPEGQPIHVVEHLQSKINAVQSCCWVTGRQSVETKTWGSCVSSSPLASQKFACFENIKVSVFLCVIVETSMFRVTFTICKILACGRCGFFQ